MRREAPAVNSPARQELSKIPFFCTLSVLPNLTAVTRALGTMICETAAFISWIDTREQKPVSSAFFSVDLLSLHT
jgi:hypothetical protein